MRTAGSVRVKTLGKGVCSMNRFVVNYLNKQVELTSCEPPEGFVENLITLFYLFCPNPNKLTGFQVWRSDGALIPVYGVKADQNTVLFADIIEDNQNEIDNSMDLGELVLENYRKWSKEMNLIQKNNFRRSGDASRFETLTQRTKLVLQAVQDITEVGIKDINVQALFQYISQLERPSVQTITRKLNISKSAFYRRQETFAKALGEWILKNLSGDDIDGLRSD